ncbi:MAG TPA: ChaN family lipoprotein [Myxococcales bacterium]|nr:ChaN family lipoprotein [Myxococcales bacterium]
MVRARIEIGRLQRRLFERQRRLIASSVFGAGAAFRAYEQRVQRRTRTFRQVASFAALLEEIARADVVYVGDYHTLKQAQRSFLKLVQRAQRPVTLALEYVQARHQAALDAYLAGDDGALDGCVDAATWPNFRPILDEARARRLTVVAIDLPGKSLHARDAFAARRIAAAARPGGQVFVLAGQLHVAPPHLPAQVARLRPELRGLTVYQNCERIWWALQREGRELEVEACVLRASEWCLINTPPVVVQQSFLDTLEGGEQLDGAFLESRFRMLARTVARFLGLWAPALRNELQQVSVYTAGDLSFLDRLEVTARERREIEQQILSRESYYIPRARIAYLANLSVNHAAEEAAHFVRHVVSGADDAPRGMVDSFYARALEEAYAFCGSKIVNPRRKCPHEPEFQRLAKAPEAGAFNRQVAKLVLHHRAMERGGRRPAKATRLAGPALFNAVTHSLGYMLGERLYYALATGRLLKREVRDLFLDPLDAHGEPLAAYMRLSRRLAGVRIPKRI